MYYLDCRCGHSLFVEIFQCGATVSCPQCAHVHCVPSSVALQTGGYDTPLERIAIARDRRRTPFDGVCQTCRTASALFEHSVIIVELNALHQRHEITIPIQFCGPCHEAFLAGWRRHRWGKLFDRLLFLTLFCFIAAIMIFVAIAISFVGLSLAILLGVLVFGRYVRRYKRPYVVDHLLGLRWVNDYISHATLTDIRVGPRHYCA